MTEFTSLREANAARQEEWDPGAYAKNIDWRITELGGELGELCNILKKLHRERCGVPGSRATMEQFAEELADVAICVDLTAMELKIQAVNPWEYKSNDLRPLTEIGTKLLELIGKVALFYRDVRGRQALSEILGVCTVLAEREGVDLDWAIAVKFNQTSEKVGLATRIAMPA